MDIFDLNANKPVLELGLDHIHYDNGDGSKRVVIGDVGYVAGGEVKLRKNFSLRQLTRDLIGGDSDYFNVSVDTKAKVLHVVIDGEEYALKLAGMYLDNQLVQAPTYRPSFSGNTITFTEIFTGIDLQFEISPYSIQEKFIVKANPLIGKAIDGLRFGFKWIEVTGKAINFTSDGKSWNSVGDDIPTEVTVTGSESFKNIDKAYLYSQHYPITIDPTIHSIQVDTSLVYFGCQWSNDNSDKDIGHAHVSDSSAARSYDLTGYPNTGTFSNASFSWGCAAIGTVGHPGLTGNIRGSNSATYNFTTYNSTTVSPGSTQTLTTNVAEWLASVNGNAVSFINFNGVHSTNYGSNSYHYVGESYLTFDWVEGGSSTNVNVSAVAGAGTGTAPTPTVGAVKTVAIACAVALGVGVASTPTVTTASVVNVNTQVVEAVGTGELPSPTVTAIKTVSITAVQADGVGISPTPSVTATKTVAITAVEATGLGTAEAPTVTAEQTIHITGVVAEGTGEAPAPTVTAGKDVNILAPFAGTPTVVTNPTTIIVDDDEAIHLGGGYYEKI
jgi:hypothetical protein